MPDWIWAIPIGIGVLLLLRAFGDWTPMDIIRFVLGLDRHE